jgi:Flp pilus assembly protein TadD
MRHPLSAVLSCLSLAGCISTLPQTTPTRAVSTRAATSDSATAGATTLLLEQGRAARRAGLYEDATTAIERALRIEPNNADLWLELGEIKLASGDEEQAAAMARKAVTLEAGDPTIAARAERLIGR